MRGKPPSDRSFHDEAIDRRRRRPVLAKKGEMAIYGRRGEGRGNSGWMLLQEEEEEEPRVLNYRSFPKWRGGCGGGELITLALKTGVKCGVPSLSPSGKQNKMGGQLLEKNQLFPLKRKKVKHTFDWTSSIFEKRQFRRLRSSTIGLISKSRRHDFLFLRIWELVWAEQLFAFGYCLSASDIPPPPSSSRIRWKEEQFPVSLSPTQQAVF